MLPAPLATSTTEFAARVGAMLSPSLATTDVQKRGAAVRKQVATLVVAMVLGIGRFKVWNVGVS
eukprot:5422395-Alexandrium_andersonii.AAC.1